ncbi:disulfide bond formation protein B [Rhodovulum sp. 12E13]|uniref:disulfide bond formation protein B n=1 Tax=Rhodovulum sp. 12E13 TaxID=2203891 RepID=UPI001F27A9EA|nr:disulfide bond formation protein B [Rhodovulum sp. 12E13]
MTPSPASTDLTRRGLVALAGAGSLALLLGAYAFEFIGGYAPCAMCYWQRWPHLAAIAVAVLGAGALPRVAGIAVGVAGALAASATGLIGVYHSGVERGWWPGPSSCTGDAAGLGGLSGEALLDPAGVAPVVMCDEIPWTLLGLSMANYNAAFSLALAAVWIVSIRAAMRPADR